jgi:3-methyladenine DNA glycosylase AlkD
VSDPAPLHRDSSVDDIVAHLRAIGTEENRASLARFGIRTERALGVGLPRLRAVARTIKRDHTRALALWQTGWREARLLAAFTADPGVVTIAQCRHWAGDFDSWEIVDGVSDLFVDTPLWRDLIEEFAGDKGEFVRRTAFAMLAWAAVHRKTEPDSTFLAYLTLIEAHTRDERNFVRKAVNWALRQIGKRSPALHGPALELARKLAASDERAARWIGKDAVRELTDPKIIARIEAKAGKSQAAADADSLSSIR